MTFQNKVRVILIDILATFVDINVLEILPLKNYYCISYENTDEPPIDEEKVKSLYENALNMFHDMDDNSNGAITINEVHKSKTLLNGTFT